MGEAAKCAYGEPGESSKDISLTEVHDCFSVTELVTMEDLGLSGERAAPRCQTDGGLKCFGHPVGASGRRMAFEIYTQLLGRAGPRQLSKVDFGLTHNFGGAPFNSVAAVSIFGRLH